MPAKTTLPGRGAPECLAKYALLACLGKTPSLSTRGADFLLRQTLLLLLYSTRPLSLSELREALDFSLKYGRSQHRQILVPDDLGDYLNSTFPGVARVQLLPAVVASITHDGTSQWSIKQSQHAILFDNHIAAWIDTLQPRDYLFFDPITRQLELVELCLKYISSVPDVQHMTESSRIEACAEFPYLRYALEALPVHTQNASPDALKAFVASELFANPRILAAASTLLPMAVRMNQSPMVEILLGRINPNAREQGSDSHTALTCAAVTGNIDMVNRLLSLPDIEVDIQVHGQMTALHIALQQEHLELARLLMSKGLARVTIQDSRGWNALNHLFHSTGARARHRQDYYGDMIKTVDQIMLSAGKIGLSNVTQTDLNIARQTGHGLIVDYLVTRYMPHLAPRKHGLLPRLLPRLVPALSKHKSSLPC